MFTLNLKKTDPTKIELEIERLYAELLTHEPDSPEYDRVSDQLVKIVTLNKEILSKSRVSPDALAGALSSLAGILIIVNFEHAHAFTSKALGMVGKKLIS